MRRLCGTIAMIGLLAATTVVGGAGAGEVGNRVSPRAVASDGGNTVFYSNWFSVPYAGQVDAVDIFFQGDTNPFNFYQLRPTGTANVYNVVFDSGPIVPSGTPNSVTTLAFPNGPANVLPGDFFGHYGRGIPYSDAGGLNANHLQHIYFSSPAAPMQGNNITLGSPAFPLHALVRDYASAVQAPGFLEQVGFGTANRPLVDNSTGLVAILANDPFTQSGQVGQWHIFSDSSVTDRSITPLLFRETSPGSYDVIGVGAARQNDNSGLQMFDFDLVDGTDLVEPGDVAGWWDGSGTTGNLGVVEWEQIGTPVIPLWLEDTDGISAGDAFTPTTAGFLGANFNRQYSINFTTIEPQQIVPEPASLAMWGLGALFAAGMFLLRRHRQAK